MITDRKVSLPDDYSVPFLHLTPTIDSQDGYMCPLYGTSDRHFSDHESSLLDYVYLRSEVESQTLMKRGAILAIYA